MPELAENFNHNQPIYSVSEVSNSLKRMVEDHFGLIRLRGEISGWKVAASGHVYFRLKDDNAVIDAICWKGTAAKLPFKAEDGLEVLATGKMTTYPGRSSYQIVVERMEPAGAGALMAILEKRKAALAAEGLFEASRKKPIPFLPRVVGVVTSPTGAVIRDILHRIEGRFPTHVIVWPVKVQGEGAAEEVARAIEGFNALTPESGMRPDVLIVARGGGSIEDLWAFNEEVVVRAAAASNIPLISAVGHETDTTLIDLASDLRAPTPTAAAEAAVPVRAELAAGLGQLAARLHAAIGQQLARNGERLEGLSRGLPRPAELLQVATQRLDDWSERLSASLPQLVARKEQQLAVLAAGLRPQALLQDAQRKQEKLTDLGARMQATFLRAHAQRQERLEALAARLESVNYEQVLKRGFALVRAEDGKLVTTAAQARTQAALQVTFADGVLTVKP
jgi:exodeoxyribonuclease VII large subunit